MRGCEWYRKFHTILGALDSIDFKSVEYHTHKKDTTNRF